VPGFPPPHAENCTFLSDSWGSLPGNLPLFSKRCLFFCHHLETCGRKSYIPRVPKKTVPGFLPPIGLSVVETRPPPLRICAFFACCKELGGSYSAAPVRLRKNVPGFRPLTRLKVAEFLPPKASLGETCLSLRHRSAGLGDRKQDKAAGSLGLPHPSLERTCYRQQPILRN
jgi:hypothetical protein